jgi:hypothetical protein
MSVALFNELVQQGTILKSEMISISDAAGEFMATATVRGRKFSAIRRKKREAEIAVATDVIEHFRFSKKEKDSDVRDRFISEGGKIEFKFTHDSIGLCGVIAIIEPRGKKHMEAGEWKTFHDVNIYSKTMVRKYYEESSK